jgi:hypothetical protein
MLSACLKPILSCGLPYPLNCCAHRQLRFQPLPYDKSTLPTLGKMTATLFQKVLHKRIRFNFNHPCLSAIILSSLDEIAHIGVKVIMPSSIIFTFHSSILKFLLLSNCPTVLIFHYQIQKE